MQTIDEDYIEDLLLTKTHNYIMFFTNKGRVYRSEGIRNPGGQPYSPRNRHHQSSAASAGGEDYSHDPGEGISHETDYLFMATRGGMVKKTPVKEYEERP